ncbi:MAG: sigma-70 family RNA polymerase sigma factor [Xanthomonadales bacterium]|nr:sigma-70 family RNA polymerase sigma factor [Xanthomonadales bacterium]
MSADRANLSGRLEAILTEHAGALAAAAARSCPHWLGITQDEFEQEIRIRLWKALSARDDLKPTPAYLFRTAATAAIDLIRSRGSAQTASLDDPDGRLAEVLGEEDGAIAAATTAERARLLELVLGELEQRRRTVLQLYLRGYTLGEIAELTQISQAAARNLVYRATDDLRSGMRERIGTPCEEGQIDEPG